MIDERFAQFFDQEKDVSFAYVFGSVAKDTSNSNSDVDVAVDLKEMLNSGQRFQRRLELISELGGLLKTPKIDLIILNDSPLLLAFNIIVDGKLVFCRDKLKRIHFEAKTMSMFFDQQYYFKRHAQMAIERIAREGIL